MENINEMIKMLCPDGVEIVKLEEITNILDSQRKPVSKGARNSGIYPYFGANGIQDYVDEYIFDGTYILLGEDGSVINKDKSPVLHWVSGKIWVNNHAHILESKGKTDLRYLYYALSETDVSDIVRGTPPKLNQSNMRGIEVPLPPLPIQQEIVRILDSFTQLQSNLEAELTARQKQYEYYRNKLLTFDKDDESVEWKTLGDIGNVRMCKRILKNQTNSLEGIPFYKIGTFGGVADAYISEELFEEYKSRYSYPQKGDILISAAGTIGRTVEFDGEPSYFQDSNIVWIEHQESLVINKYLRAFYAIADWKIQNGGSVSRLYNDNLKSTIIPIPPLSRQREIVSILDTFESLITNLKKEIALRQKQYEYYREQLLTFE